MNAPSVVLTHSKKDLWSVGLFFSIYFFCFLVLSLREFKLKNKNYSDIYTHVFCGVTKSQVYIDVGGCKNIITITCIGY